MLLPRLHPKEFNGQTFKHIKMQHLIDNAGHEDHHHHQAALEAELTALQAKLQTATTEDSTRCGEEFHADIAVDTFLEEGPVECVAVSPTEDNVYPQTEFRARAGHTKAEFNAALVELEQLQATADFCTRQADYASTAVLFLKRDIKLKEEEIVAVAAATAAAVTDTSGLDGDDQLAADAAAA